MTWTDKITGIEKELYLFSNDGDNYELSEFSHALRTTDKALKFLTEQEQNCNRKKLLQWVVKHAYAIQNMRIELDICPGAYIEYQNRYDGDKDDCFNLVLFNCRFNIRFFNLCHALDLLINIDSMVKGM